MGTEVAAMEESRELLEKVERLKLILVQRATGGGQETSEFTRLRRDLLAQPSIKGKFPGFLKYCTNLGEFWGAYQGEVQYLPAAARLPPG